MLLIVGLLMGGMLFTYSAQVDQSNRQETQRRLELARELVIGFAIVNGRLPCPAPVPPPTNATGTGDESPSGGGTCTLSYAGYLPGKTIGFQPVNAAGYAVDAWGNPIRYAIAKDSYEGSTSYPDTYVFTTSGQMKSAGVGRQPKDLVVCGAIVATTDGAASPPTCGTTSAVALTSQYVVAAVVWATGKNSVTETATRPEENTNNKTTTNSNHGLFMYRLPTTVDSALGEFDDQMVWLPASQLYGRLISAGVLP